MGCERQQERGSISLPDPPVLGFHASPFCTGTLGTVADSWLQSQSSERRSVHCLAAAWNESLV